MIYLKSIGAGLIAAVTAAGAVILIELLRAAIVIAWHRNSGSGGIGAVSSGLPELMAIPIAFIAAFWWRFRKRHV